MKALSSLFIPSATQSQLDDMVAVQLASSSAETAAQFRLIVDQFSVLDVLSEVEAETLIIHARHDSIHPHSQGRLLASQIRNAQFVTLESNNHVPLPEEPSWPYYIESMLEFLQAP